MKIPSHKDNLRTFEIKVADPKGATLELNVECKLEKEGNCQISVYCPFWIVNYTGLTMLYKKKSGSDVEDIEDLNLVAGHYIKSDVYSDDNEYVNVIPGTEMPFMCSESQIRIKVDASGWSSPISLNKMGTMECIKLPETMYIGSKKLFLIGVNMDSAKDQFWRTKIIKFTSWYLLVNDTRAPLFVRQQGTGEKPGSEEDGSIVRLNPGESKPFHWFDRTAPHKVCVSQGGSEWSNGLIIEKVGTFPFKLRPSQSPLTAPSPTGDSEKRTTKKMTFYNVVVNPSSKGEEASTTIRFIKSHERFPPYMIKNKTAMVSLSIFQRDLPDGANAFAETVDPGDSVPYCWDDLCEPHILRVSFYGYDEHADFELDSLYQKSVFSACGMEFYVSVTADGPTRVFCIEDKLEGPAANTIHNATTNPRERGGGSGNDDESGISFSIKLPEIGVSLVDSAPQELLYMTLTDTNAAFSRTGLEESYELGIFKIQVDNQLYNTPYPVLMLPRNSSYGRDNYFLHISLKKRMDEKIDYYEYFAVSVKEMNIFVEETLFYLLSNFYTDVSRSFTTYAVTKDTGIDNNKDQKATTKPGDDNSSDDDDDGKDPMNKEEAIHDDEEEDDGNEEEGLDRMAYFDVMYINSIFISLSFQSSTNNEIPAEGSLYKIMSLTT